MTSDSAENRNATVSEGNRSLRNAKFHLIPICIGFCFVIILAAAVITLLLITKSNEQNIEQGKRFSLPGKNEMPKKSCEAILLHLMAYHDMKNFFFRSSFGHFIFDGGMLAGTLAILS